MATGQTERGRWRRWCWRRWEEEKVLKKSTLLLHYPCASQQMSLLKKLKKRQEKNDKAWEALKWENRMEIGYEKKWIQVSATSIYHIWWSQYCTRNHLKYWKYKKISVNLRSGGICLLSVLCVFVVLTRGEKKKYVAHRSECIKQWVQWIISRLIFSGNRMKKRD